MINIIIKKKEMFSFWFGSYHFILALITPLILACYHLNIMSVDIQERMKQDIQSFEDLGTLIEQCLDNFQNVIQPKIPKTKIKVAQNDFISHSRYTVRPDHNTTQTSFKTHLLLSVRSFWRRDQNKMFLDINRLLKYFHVLKLLK